MLRHHIAVALLVLSSPIAARAQDGGAAACVEDAVDGGVNAYGQCDGDLLRYCSAGVVESWDCSHAATPDDVADDYYPDDVSAECALIEAEYGYDCAISAGGSCLFDDQGNVVQAHCAGAQPGCVVDLAADRAACVDTAPACPADGGVGCVGDLSVLGCLHGQVLAVDCASGGGTCGADGACALPGTDGGPPPPPLTGCGACAAGFVCNAVTATCVPANDPGEGEGEPAPEEPAPRRTALCAATDTGSTGAPWHGAAAILVAAAALLRRRRPT